MATARLTRLSYWYPGAVEPALRDVSLTIAAGVTLVVGASGGGKSTLLRVFNGLVPHFHGGRIDGAAQVMGSDVIATPTRRLARDVGFVFQDPELQSVYDTVEREVAFGLENFGVAASAMPGRVDDALAEAGVQHLAARRIRTLSGGERQRVAIASVLAMRPRLVVLDEPTSQLDPDGAALVLSSATRLAGSGHDVVIAEHRLEALPNAVDAVLNIESGRVRALDPKAWRPATLEVEATRLSAPGTVAWALQSATLGFRDRPILEGVDLAGRSGEVVVLRGPNGGGKTTLLRSIAGSLSPLAGSVERAPGRIAYLPQNPAALLHRPTVSAEVELTLGRAGEPSDTRDILAALGLLGVADRYPRDLSSGERQRAALAAVLAGRPRLVLLDEPTRGMDSLARAALITLVAHLRDEGSAVVLATHDGQLQEALADRVVDACGGRVIESQAVRR